MESETGSVENKLEEALETLRKSGIAGTDMRVASVKKTNSGIVAILGPKLPDGTTHSEHPIPGLELKPLYYQQLARINPGVGENESYDSGIQVSRGLGKKLMSLVGQNGFFRNMAVYSKEELMAMVKSDALNKIDWANIINESNDLNQGFVNKHITPEINYFYQIIGIFNRRIIRGEDSRAEFPEILDKMESRIGYFKGFFLRDNEELRKQIKKYKKKLGPEADESEINLLKSLNIRNYASKETEIIEKIRNKVKRMKLLKEIDGDLALAYFVHDHGEGVFGFIDIYPGKDLDDSAHDQYWKADEQMYQSILDNLKFKEKNRNHSSEVDIKPLEVKKTGDAYTLLESKIINIFKGNFSEDMRLRTSYFVDDIRLNGVSNNYVSGLSEVFGNLNIGRQVKRINNQGEAEQKVRNFFDDVTLMYVLKGDLPTKKDLELVYSKA